MSTVRQDLLSIHDLKVYYTSWGEAIRAVDCVNFSISEGEVVALVGESGSGKTTVALAILRLLSPSAKISGRIVYKDADLLESSEEWIQTIRGKEIAMIFQDPASYLNPLMKVGDQIAEAIRLHGRSGREDAKKRAIEMLRAVRIPDPEKAYDYHPHQLSGGMAQRVGIAIAIACRPSLLIADEPTTALDLTVQGQIMHLLKTINNEMRLAILLITHDLGVVAGVADRVIVMYAGHLMEEADVFSLFKDPKHPYTQVLLSASRYSHGDSMANAIKVSSPSLATPPLGCIFHPRCPYALPRCKDKKPPEINLSDKRRIACWLYE